MKLKHVLPALFMFLALNSFANVSNLIPVIKNVKGNFSQTEKTSLTKFELTCSEADMKEVKAHAEEINYSAIFTAKSIGKNIYACELNITVQNHAEYVHKVFMKIGFTTFEFDGKKYPITDIGVYLKKLL